MLSFYPAGFTGIGFRFIPPPRLFAHFTDKTLFIRTFTMTNDLTPLSPKERSNLLIRLGILKAPDVKQRRASTASTGKSTSTHRRPIECVTTGEVFPSITAAAQAHGVKPSNLSWHLKGHYTATGGKTYKYVDPKTQPIPHNQRTRKAVRCVDDGQTFPSLTQAAKHYGVAPNGLSLHLRGMQTNVGGKKFEYV